MRATRGNTRKAAGRINGVPSGTHSTSVLEMIRAALTLPSPTAVGEEVRVRLRSGSLALLAFLVTVAAACAPQAASPREAGGTQANRSAGAAKTLVVGIQREPTDLGVLFGQGTATTAGGAGSVKLMVHDRLAQEMDLDRWEPQLATALPSIDNGSWRVNADGTMDTTFRLRPGIKWHDGTPFTADDLLFSFRIFLDPDLPTGGSQKRFMESASAPDANTFVIHWSGTYVEAPQGSIGVIRPRHLLEDVYLRDKDAFINSPWFTTEFVGLGPYKLASWELGSHMELARFEDYYQGRPPLDRIVIRFVGDPNALAAGILAGELDVVLPVTVDLDVALDLRRRWEGTGNQVRIDVTGQLPQLEMQYRVDAVRPRNGFLNPTVRQAFYQVIDRQSLTDVMTQGLAPVADSWFPPSHVLRPEVESAIPQFAFDVARAQTLLAQAGWNRGPDGTLVNAQTGERFETELWGLTGQTFGIERHLSIIADGWKAVGAHTDFGAIPPARLRDAQYVAEHPGPLLTSFAARQFAVDRMHSDAIPSAANRWSGFNRGGYSNPSVDDLFARLNVTIDEGQRVAITRQMLQELMGNVVLMPLYWEVVPTLMVKGVTGPKHVGTDTTRNIFQWDKS